MLPALFTEIYILTCIKDKEQSVRINAFERMPPQFGNVYVSSVFSRYVQVVSLTYRFPVNINLLRHLLLLYFYHDRKSSFGYRPTCGPLDKCRWKH